MWLISTIQGVRCHTYGGSAWRTVYSVVMVEDKSASPQTDAPLAT